VHVDLPRENWVELKELDELTGKDVKAARRAMRISTDGDVETLDLSIGIMDDAADALAARIITSWSFDEPVPYGQVEKLENLPADVYAALGAAMKPYLKLVQFSPNT
jgi:hypothetical protein